jgi:hypothetical protein
VNKLRNEPQTRFERSEEGSFPYWVCLIEEKCTGGGLREDPGVLPDKRLDHFQARAFGRLAKEWYQIFRFAEACKSTAENEFIRLKEARGKNWAQWKKGTYTPKASKPPTTSDTKPDYVGTARVGLNWSVGL